MDDRTIEHELTAGEPGILSPIDIGLLSANAAIIRNLGKRVVGDIIEIGRRLADCKKIAGHGNWLPWLEREFGWSDKTAERYMQVAALKFDNLSNIDLPVSSLYLLAAPSTPDEVRDEVIDRVKSGEKVSHEKVKEKIAKAKPAKARKPKSKAKPAAKPIDEPKPVAEPAVTLVPEPVVFSFADMQAMWRRAEATTTVPAEPPSLAHHLSLRVEMEDYKRRLDKQLADRDRTIADLQARLAAAEFCGTYQADPQARAGNRA